MNNAANLLYTAEVENLLTHDNLLAFQKSGGRFRNLTDKRVYEMMCLRIYSLQMRFGRLIVDPADLASYETDLRRIVDHAGVRVRSFEPTEDNAPDADARLVVLLDRLDDALNDTRYAEVLKKESEQSRRQAYRELTGDRFFHQW